MIVLKSLEIKMGKLQLKNITLLSLNCVDPIQSAKALLYSSKDIDFAEMILISNKKPDNLPSEIKFIETNVHTHKEVSQFTYTQLPNYIRTDYCLTIHDDGFVINPHLWTDEFLKYDYIGAPWKNLGQRNRVGNAGFCLRSNRFIQLTRYLNFRGTHDDTELTNDYYDFFTQNGCKYAPLEVAMKFSLESKIPECEYNLENCFGFHGRGLPETVSVHEGQYQMFQDKVKLLNTIQI
jgi:hypothetical protein